MDNVLVDLAPQDLLAVQGEDSGKFLQGQLTCDLAEASPTRSIPGAFCNNKGRVLASFQLHRSDDDHYLVMRAGLLPICKSNLDRYIVFYKAKTRDAGSDFRRLGLLGEEARALLSEHFPTLPAQAGDVLVHDGCRLTNRQAAPSALPRYELWLPEGNGEALQQRLAAALSPAPLERWELEDLRHGIYFIGPEDSGEHTVQVLNYDLAGFVNFKKGCYTGQEIVARMHYRGSAKRRLFPLQTRAPDGDLPGRGPVLDTAGAKAGELLRLLPSSQGRAEGVAVLDIDKAAASGLRLENPPLELALPQGGFSYTT